MNISRLTKGIRMDNGDRFILFYGQVNDEFCDDELVLGNIDFMLWRYFRKQGYKRIVFYDGAEKITFYDDESRKLCLPQASSKSTPRSNLTGPLGDRKLWRSGSSRGTGDTSSQTATTGADPSLPRGSASQQSGMSDLNALEILNSIMKDDNASQSTVIIFPLAEDIGDFQQTGSREMRNRLIRWVRNFSQRTRKCVFIFQQSTLEEVKEIVKTHELHGVSNFIKEKEKGEDASNIVGVGFPDEREITNLIHHYRLGKSLEVDWQILAKIAVSLSKQRLPLLRLNAMVSGMQKLNKDALQDWSKTGLIKLTPHQIENIGQDTNVLDSQGLTEKLSAVCCQEDNIAQLKDDVEVWYAQAVKSKPLSFFLGGPSGVGKTYTVELLAEALAPLGYEYCYFAMNEFSEEHSASKLIGSPPGYIGSEDEPKLFAALNSSSRLVICFDEIEKAHLRVFTTLMQLLDKGFLSWNKGEGDFKECIVCFTSNAKRQELTDLKAHFQQSGKPTAEPEFQNKVRDILVRAQIPPEVCGRIDNFLVYNPLTPEAIVEINWQEVKKLAKSYNLEVVSIAPVFLAEVAGRAANPQYGFRSAKKMISAKLGKILAQKSREKSVAKPLIITKTENGYIVKTAADEESIPTREELINQAVKIYQANAAALSFLDTEQLSQRLASVICQEDNIAQLIDAVEVWYTQAKKDRPLSFFLGGTSGVGKTYTVEVLAKALQPLGYEDCYFAMNEFSEKQTVSNLIGSSRGYVGSEEEPKLFEALNRSTRLVICFDEIEKAHKQILTTLMQLLDKGFLSWSKGEGDFKECIICFTSNAQRQELVDLKNHFKNSNKPTAEPEFQNKVRDILVQAQIAPEVCRRINNFLVYNPLTQEALVEITWQEVKKLAKKYRLEVVSIAPEFLAEVARKAASSQYGAGPVRDEVEKLGKTLIAVKKDRQEASKVVIEKGSDGYQALPADEAASVGSSEEMIAEAKELVSTAAKTAQSAIAAAGGKPKRLLRLHDLPSSLPGKSDSLPSGTNLLNQVLPAVAYVEVQMQDGKEGSGSGFVITPDGKFITSFHVIEGAVLIRVRFDNRPQEWVSAEFMDGDKEADIAVLKLYGSGFPYVLLAPYGDRIERGEVVGLLGYPLGEDLASTVTYTGGVISNFIQRSSGVGMLQVDANAYHGSSGGPLLRLRDGRVIGILMGGRKEAVQINYAVSINELYKRLLYEY